MNSDSASTRRLRMKKSESPLGARAAIIGSLGQSEIADRSILTFGAEARRLLVIAPPWEISRSLAGGRKNRRYSDGSGLLGMPSWSLFVHRIQRSISITAL